MELKTILIVGLILVLHCVLLTLINRHYFNRLKLQLRDLTMKKKGRDFKSNIFTEKCQTCEKYKTCRCAECIYMWQCNECPTTDCIEVFEETHFPLKSKTTIDLSKSEK